LKIAIVGSRAKYENPNNTVLTDGSVLRHEAVKAYVKSLPQDTIIISGGAHGVDTVAEVTAEAIGLKTQIFPAEWRVYGRSAGYKRNQLIVEAADKVVIFWDGVSKGTKHSLDIAIKLGKSYEVRIFPELG
jgi:hypothetical protein